MALGRAVAGLPVVGRHIAAETLDSVTYSGVIKACSSETPLRHWCIGGELSICGYTKEF